MPESKKIIFSIETSCDETAMALVEAKGKFISPKFKVIKNAILSQIAKHKEFGGVVPNIAKREHQKALPEMLEIFEVVPEFEDIDIIAVTVGPGLEPALWTGIEFAEDLGKKINKPVFPANHIKGHLYSFLLSSINNINELFPAVALIVSGGHTILLLLNSISEYKVLGETKDDAAGEAFDKGARLLGLPYPGGPELEKLALKGNSATFNFPRPMANQDNFDFSFAGLKTALLYKLKDSYKANWKDINKKAISGISDNLASGDAEDIAASYQQAIIDCLAAKTFKAVKKFSARSVIISGGVAANKALRKAFAEIAKKENIEFLAPEQQFNTDNAAMIAASSYIESLQGIERPLEANGNLSL